MLTRKIVLKRNCDVYLILVAAACVGCLVAVDLSAATIVTYVVRRSATFYDVRRSE